MPEEASGIDNLLHEKVGGIPAPVLGLVGGGAIIGIIYLRNRSKTSHASSATDTTGGGTTDSSLVTYDGTGTVDPNAVDPNTGLTNAESQFPTGPLDSYLAQNPAGASYPVGLTPQGLPGPITNVQWARLAGDYLMGQGDDPALVANALQNFISGKPLTTAEQAIVAIALRTFGEPPEGILPVTPSPVPSPTPTPGPGPVPPPPPGGGTQTVPNVVGMRVENAMETLQDAGFRGTFGPRRPGVPYKVTAQSPAGGTKIRFGEAVFVRRIVRLTIAPEPVRSTVPPVRPLPVVNPGGPEVQELSFNPPGFP